MFITCVVSCGINHCLLNNKTPATMYSDYMLLNCIVPLMFACIKPVIAAIAHCDWADWYWRCFCVLDHTFLCPMFAVLFFFLLSPLHQRRSVPVRLSLQDRLSCKGGSFFLSRGTPHIHIDSGHVTVQLPVSLPVPQRTEKIQRKHIDTCYQHAHTKRSKHRVA